VQKLTNCVVMNIYFRSWRSSKSFFGVLDASVGVCSVGSSRTN